MFSDLIFRPPLRWHGLFVVHVLQLLVVHLVGTALPEIQLCSFGLHCSLLRVFGFASMKGVCFSSQLRVARPRGWRSSELSGEPWQKKRTDQAQGLVRNGI